jgi:hypothetical protein
MSGLTIGSIGEELNLVVVQGASLRLRFTMTNSVGGAPVNLSGITFQSQVRKSRSSSQVVLTLNFVVSNVLTGEYALNLTAAETAAMAVSEDPNQNKYVWDMRMTDSTGLITPLYYGVFEIFPSVTRA